MAEVKTMQEYREVGFLIEPEVTHVSIVDRGANQTPFKVVKNHKGGERMAKVVYSIVAPKNVSKEDIQKALGEELINVVKFDNTAENGEVVRYIQQPIDAFKEDTLSLVEINKELNIKALCAEPKEEEGNFIGKLFKKKAEVIMTDEVELPVEEVLKSVSWEVSDEMYALFQAVDGVLSQTNGDVSKKLKAVKDLWGNFYSFLSESLSVSKGEALTLNFSNRIEKKESEDGEVQTETQTEEIVKEDIVEDKTAETLEVTPEVTLEVEKAEEAAPEAVAPVLEDVVKAEVEKATAPILELLKAMSEKLDGSVAEIKKMEQMVPSVPTSTESDPAPVKKSDRPAGDFTGSIFGIR